MQNGERNCSGHGSDISARTAGKRGAADDNSNDRRKHILVADGDEGGAGVTDDADPGQPGEQAGQAVKQRADQRDRQSYQRRRPLVRADGIDGETEGRAAQYEQHDRSNTKPDEEHAGNAENERPVDEARQQGAAAPEGTPCE